MSWATRFRIRQYVQASLWLPPLLGVVLGVILGFVDARVEHAINLPSNWTYSASTAASVLSAIVGAMAALTGFVVTVAVLVVQMVLGTFSARFMRVWYTDPMLKTVLAVIVGTLAFALSLLRRVESTFVPSLGVSMAGLLVLVSLLLFVVFFGSYLHRLRPVEVAAIGTGYLRQNLDRLTTALDNPLIFSEMPRAQGKDPTWVVPSAGAGVIQAVDLKGLAGWASTGGCLVELKHRVGDFVPKGATLFNVYGDGPGTARQEKDLQGMVALGTERTVEQDPAFAMRITVDIAVKALSAAINDPTTAVQVLSQLAEVLRIVGTADLHLSRLPADGARPDGLVIPVRSWEEYLAMGVTEIREFGSSSIQVMRRMRALLEQLQREVLPQNRQAVAEELRRLDATVESSFGASVDLDLAKIPDEQGIGGRIEATTSAVATG